MVSNPRILLCGDFNLPSITWLDGGIINSCPTYDHEINQLFLDTINEFGLEQLITQITRVNNILDLVFFIQLNIISNLQVIPGISDCEAILFHLGLATSLSVHVPRVKHPILLYHKGNLDGLKADMFEFQNEFMSTDPYSYDIETNWLHFKSTLNIAINTNIPQITPKSQNHLPWLNCTIRKRCKRENIYIIRLSLLALRRHGQATAKYVRNEITKEISEAHS